MSSFFSGWMCLGSIAAVTLAISCFTQLRNLYKQLISRIVVNLTVSGHQADAMLLYAREHFQPSRFGTRSFVGWKLYHRPDRRVQLMPMEVNAATGRLYWLRWRPIWIADHAAATQSTGGSSGGEEPTYSITVTYARGTIDADQLILAATNYYNQQTQRFDATGGRRHSIKYISGSAGMSVAQFNSTRSRASGSPTSASDVRGCLIHRPLGFQFSDIGQDSGSPDQAIDRLALSSSAEHLVEEVRRWYETESWHRQRQLPWRRGFLLYGPPGTGKTALARAIAEELDLPVHVFDLASLRNDELLRAWNQMLEETPCMALMEDIDSVFHGRTNVAVSSGPALTFDCLLNVLDGVQRSDGLLTVMTTNHIEQVDAAIAQPGAIGSRPGRIDRVVHLGQLNEQGRQKIAMRILDDHPELIPLVCQQGQTDTPAQFQERCARLALALHYEGTPVHGESPVVPVVPIMDCGGSASALVS